MRQSVTESISVTLEPDKLVMEQPDSTLAELKARLATEKVNVSQSATFRFLRHLKLPFKKRVSTRPNKIGKTSPPSGEALRKAQPTLIRNDRPSSMKPQRPPR
jgi:hypothetical protein